MTFHDRKIKASTFITLGIEGISISTPTTPVSRTQVLNPQWLADAMAARIEFVFTQKKLLKFNTSPDGKRQWCSCSTHHLIQVCIFKGNVFCKNCEKWYEMILFSWKKILHQLIGSLSHFLQGFKKNPRWCRSSAINSSNGQKKQNIFSLI